MTEQQDVLDPQRPTRRRIPVILLGILPAAIAATLLVAGPNYVAPVAASNDASGEGTVAAPSSTLTPGVLAPSAAVNTVGTVPEIKVILPVKHTAPAVKVGTVTTSVGATSVKSVKIVRHVKTVKHVTQVTHPKKSGKSYTSFCANPSNPVSTFGSSGQALLSAVNKERAKLGIHALSWNSSFASIATNWSKTMVKKDAQTKSKLIDGLSHNPNRPGAENVAVVYSSGGYSASTAVNKMHTNLVYSQGHCLNLMNPSYHSMGAGVAKSSDGDTWYVTEDFR